jgi:uncharacterized membrane protein YedE/YeeE
MHHFTPWRALGGGVLLGVAASLLWLSTGRAAGVSGILAGLFSPRSDERRWRALFLAGLVAGGLVLRIMLAPSAFAAAERGLPLVATAGLLVGFGARLGGGCTSGHGICGLGRLSLRSLIAVGVFMASGFLTVALVGGSR